MKKKLIIFPLLAMSLSSAIFAQKFDQDKLTLLLTQKKYADVQAELDKAKSNPKNQAIQQDIMGFQFKLDNQIATDSTAKAAYPNANATLLSSFKNLLQAVPDTAKQRTYISPSVNGIGSLYASSFNNGAAYFRDKKYLEAYNNFKVADYLGSYLIQNGYTSSPKESVDTTILLYTAVNAQFVADSLNKPEYADTAATYYNQLINHGIINENMESALDWLIKYYDGKKDTQNSDKILALAKKHFPNDAAYWENVESKKMIGNKTPEEILAVYNAGKETFTENQYADFSNTFGKAQTTTEDHAKAAQFQDAQLDALKHLLKFNSKNEEYTTAVGTNYMKQWSDVKDEYTATKGATPAAKAKRLDLNKKADVLSDSAIQYLTQSFDIIKDIPTKTKRQSLQLKTTANYLVLLYQDKMDRARGYNAAAYTKYEALFNKYNKEYTAIK